MQFAVQMCAHFSASQQSLPYAVVAAAVAAAVAPAGALVRGCGYSSVLRYSLMSSS